MIKSIENLCPFSKPLMGQWCQCPYARLIDRCSGKMSCSGGENLYDSCNHLAKLLKQKSRFILGLNSAKTELTHAHSVKIRCGGLLGMQRHLEITVGQAPLIRDVINAAEARYGRIDDFPYDKIIQDINNFSHRNSRRK